MSQILLILPRYWSLLSKRFMFSKEQIILAMISTFMSTNVSSEANVHTWVKSNNYTAIKSPKLKKRNLWTTILFLYSCEKDLSDARDCFLYLCMTRILRLLPCWGRFFTWVPHSSLLRFFSLYVIISACVVVLHMGCSLCSSSQLNSSNLTTGIC